MGTRSNREKKLSLRLTSEQEEALEEIVITRGYKNKSQALRFALERFIEDSKESYNSEKITIEVSKVHLEELDKLLDFIGASTRPEAIRLALRQFLQSENEFLLRRTEEYEELRARYRKRVYTSPKVDHQ